MVPPGTPARVPGTADSTPSCQNPHIPTTLTCEDLRYVLHITLGDLGLVKPPRQRTVLFEDGTPTTSA